MFHDGYVLGGADGDARHRVRRRAAADVRQPAEVLAAPAGELHQRVLPRRTRRPASTTTGSRFPPIDKDGTLYAGELTVVGRNGDRPEVVDFLNRFIGEDVQCAMGGVAASSRISPNVNVGPDCYANDILADASVVLTEALKDGTGRFDASDLMPAEVGSGSFWTGDGRVHEGRSRQPRRRCSKTSRTAGRPRHVEGRRRWPLR